ncbi:C6 finger domain-containing protein [Stagonosporopsis vannaccii]|nr:C6 finger domain-containing protein [Stagonosporopsis vannaccii]
MVCDQPELKSVLGLALQEAFTTPYLMDELLAFSAAHKSTLDNESRSRRSFSEVAARLQNRALASFNESPVEVADANCLAMFMFSTVLGHHVVFDIFSSYGSLNAVLDGLVGCLNIHRGIRVIASKAWPQIQAQLKACLPSEDQNFLQTTDSLPNSSHDACNNLLGRLSSSEMSQTAIDVCCEAIRILQYILDRQPLVNSSSAQRYTAVQDWLVRVSSGYIDLLNQRRPEALVVLAHYAVILHRARDYWTVGNAGAILLRFIKCHLGAYWQDWLAWPSQIIDCQDDNDTQ